MHFRSLTSVLLAAAVLSIGPLLPAADSAAVTRTINIRAGVDNAMKFDVTRIAAAPGETIKIILTNASNLPKAAMGHNWILLTAGADVAAFATAAATEAASGYVPAKWQDRTLAVINLLGPGESGEVTVKVPAEPGEYPFLCSFPAHCLIGMKGVLVVKP